MSQIGKKIQVFAIVIMAVSFFSATVGAIVTWVLTKSFWAGSGILAGGYLSAYFLYLLLRGFGIIVSASEEKMLATNNNFVPQTNNGQVFQQPANQPTAYQAPAQTPANAVGVGEWRCTKCGRVNQKYVGTCGCGEARPI